MGIKYPSGAADWKRSENNTTMALSVCILKTIKNIQPTFQNTTQHKKQITILVILDSQ